MTKRILSFLLLVAMLLSCALPAQAAEEPNPIPVIAKEDRTVGQPHRWPHPGHG